MRRILGTDASLEELNEAYRVHTHLSNAFGLVAERSRAVHEAWGAREGIETIGELEAAAEHDPELAAILEADRLALISLADIQDEAIRDGWMDESERTVKVVAGGVLAMLVPTP